MQQRNRSCQSISVSIRLTQDKCREVRQATSCISLAESTQAMWELHSWLGGVHISTRTKEVSFVFIVFVSIFVNSYQITCLQIIDPVN